MVWSIFLEERESEVACASLQGDAWWCPGWAGRALDLASVVVGQESGRMLYVQGSHHGQ